jgi:phage-related protein|tara:strand:+ start:458 stop:1063 length:606 start_codon:yes stop_codon:yes gene_type:complete
MADENSIYNIMEYVGAKAYSKNDIVVVLERFSSDNYPGNGGFQVPKSATYYYSTNSSSSVPADSPSADSTLWAGTTRYQDRIKPEFIWNPSYNISVENSPRINSVVFGNGYEQRIKDGIFNNLIKLSLRFEHRNIKEAQAINHFLRTRSGTESFVFKNLPEPYNDLSAGGYKKLFVCKTFNSNFVFYNNYTIDATFEEVNN